MLSVSRKERLRERRLLKDFNIDLVETVMEAFMKDVDRKNKFSLIRRLTTGKRENAKKNWNAIVGAARAKQNPIGKTSMHSGSIKDLREKVLQEQEMPPMRGARRFAHAARRVAREHVRSNKYEDTSCYADIEEEIPGTFSSSVTSRNSTVPDTGEINQQHPQVLVTSQECAVINVEPGDSAPDQSKQSRSSKVQGLIASFDSTESPRRHTAPASEGADPSYLSKRRNAKPFTEVDDKVGWI